jgi:DNA invertase Pin-like site-specific DNA recombinase
MVKQAVSDRSWKAPTPANLAAAAPAGIGLGSSKIQARHRDKLAVVYIRQSTNHQVQEHRESLARQYALRDHAAHLGWPAERILLIDEDLGRSAATDQRSGFQRLLGEVGLGHVGLVLALEASRLCRCNKDWAHLTEVCSLWDTLLTDQDGIYDPNDLNDRLLLGLKGTMSELELALMRNRLERGRQNKAARGEMFQKVPIGYVKLANGQVALDPDEQVRAVVRLLFAKLQELGSVRQVFRYLLAQHIQLGIRVQEGPERGQLQWRPPRVPTLYYLFHHPMYAGAYAYGRFRRQRRGTKTQPLVKGLPPEQWKVLLRERVPGYITWEQFVANQERLRQNGSRRDCRGAVRAGPALLSGLVYCGHCGWRMQAQYCHGRKNYYACIRRQHEPDQTPCPGISAVLLDPLVEEQLLRALEPAGLELSRQAFDDLEREQTRLEQHWQQRLERARYDAERAQRQYQGVEPENRLVARTLEQQWEEALRRQRQVQEDYDRFQAGQRARPSAEQYRQIEALAQDLPAVWHAPQTTPPEKKEIVRCLVERVAVTRQPGQLEADVVIHWHGGHATRQQLHLRGQRYVQLPEYQRLLDRVVYWRQQGCTMAQIADHLNEEGLRPPRRQAGYTEEMVQDLLHRRGLGAESKDPQLCRRHEWRTCHLARELGITQKRLHAWIQRGWVRGRQTPIHKRWLVWADAREVKRLKRLAAAIDESPSGRPGPGANPPNKRGPNLL